jgi:hypothetical protein
MAAGICDDDRLQTALQQGSSAECKPEPARPILENFFGDTGDISCKVSGARVLALHAR